MPHPLSALPSSLSDSVAPSRVLVADDDPGSRRFLCDGLQSLGAWVQPCSDGTAALKHASAENFNLLLLDCRMPGAGALQILAQLREDPQAASSDSFAVATSAELEPAVRQSLLSAGFSDVLLKPCGLADLQRILVLARPGHHGTLLLDDNVALATTGDDATMRALRSLLRDELTLLDRELDPLSQDHANFAERLHRLRSSCGFCGASALSAQVVLLQHQLARPGNTVVPLTRFRSALRATIEALDR